MILSPADIEIGLCQLLISNQQKGNDLLELKNKGMLSNEDTTVLGIIQQALKN